MKRVVIVSAVRTAIGDFNGSLGNIPATKLGAIVIAEVIKRAGLNKEEIDEVIMGNVLPSGLGQNPARQATLLAGLPFGAAAFTINKVCGSGLMAAMLGIRSIVAGEAEIVVAGGMENMNLAPYYLEKARTGYRMGNGKLIDGMVHDGLWDVVNDFHMGYTAELVAEKYRITRKDADRFALNSYQKALKAVAEGKFKKEIIPVEVPQGKGPSIIFETDEIPRETSLEALAKLKPVFKEGGQVTAGNSSKISDGAAAVVLMSEKKADKLGIKPLARIVAQGVAGIELKYVLTAPILSIPKTLKKAKLQEKDIDLHEINEAFSTSTVAVIRELDIDESKVNVNGGAIALGHPIGASGARVLVTLLYAMKQRDTKRGMATLCLGGGEAVSLIVER